MWVSIDDFFNVLLCIYRSRSLSPLKRHVSLIFLLNRRQIDNFTERTRAHWKTKTNVSHGKTINPSFASFLSGRRGANATHKTDSKCLHSSPFDWLSRRVEKFGGGTGRGAAGRGGAGMSSTVGDLITGDFCPRTSGHEFELFCMRARLLACGQLRTLLRAVLRAAWSLLWSAACDGAPGLTNSFWSPERALASGYNRER